MIKYVNAVFTSSRSSTQWHKGGSVSRKLKKTKDPQLALLKTRRNLSFGGICQCFHHVTEMMILK